MPDKHKTKGTKKVKKSKRDKKSKQSLVSQALSGKSPSSYM